MTKSRIMRRNISRSMMKSINKMK